MEKRTADAGLRDLLCFEQGKDLFPGFSDAFRAPVQDAVRQIRGDVEDMRKRILRKKLQVKVRQASGKQAALHARIKRKWQLSGM